MVVPGVGVSEAVVCIRISTSVAISAVMKTSVQRRFLKIVNQSVLLRSSRTCFGGTFGRTVRCDSPFECDRRAPRAFLVLFTCLQ